MRDLLSYDDIASQAPEQDQSSSHITEPESPPKKRRKNNRQRHRNQYADDIEQVDNEYKTPIKKPRRDYGLKEESRKLTHEEVWDDSALINAWDAAVEEYEVLNGPDKKWKSEPVNKSALWFNVPSEAEEVSEHPEPSFLMPAIPSSFAVKHEESPQLAQTDPENSKPVNFDTFVPRHDPALSQVDVPEEEQSHSLDARSFSKTLPIKPPGVSGHVSKDEAFQQAIGAWYWAGYWSGVYHSTNASPLPDAAEPEPKGDVEYENVEDMMHESGHVQEEDIIVDGSSSDEARAEQEELIPT